MPADSSDSDLTRAAFEAARAAMALLSPDGAILELNAASRAIVGPFASALIGQNVLDMLRSPGNVATGGAALAQLAAGEPHASFELSLALPAGPAIIEVLLTPLRRDDGAVRALLAEAHDVTARRRAEHALRRSEARFRRILDAGWDIVSLQDATGAMTYWSGSTERVHGFTPAELFAHDPRARVHPDDLPRAVAAHAEVRQHPGATQSYELRFRTKDERWIWLQSIAVNLLDDPDVQSVLTTTRDITARKQNELSLAAAEQHLRQIGEALRDVLWILDPATAKIVYLSPAAPRVWGRSDVERLDDLPAWIESIVPEDLPRCLDALGRGVRGDPIDISFNIRLETGARRPLRLTCFPLRDASGALVRVVGTTRDITAEQGAEEAARAARELLERRVAERTADLRAANVALAHADRAKDEFLATMSHELRTPLNAVLGIAEALEVGVYGELGEPARVALGRIGESGRHLLDLLAGILDLTNVAAGELSLALVPTGVDEVCRAALGAVEEEARAKRHAISFSTPPRGLLVRADAQRLTQILVHLLRNAVKFTPAGGTVGLAAAADPGGGSVRFTVWDTGVGVAPADHARMFEPFVQLDGRLSRGHGGAGIGLTLVRRLVELHGGTVSVESEVGRGSRFHVLLPTGSPSNHAPAAPEPAR